MSTDSPPAAPGPIPELRERIAGDSASIFVPSTHAHHEVFIARAPGCVRVMGGGDSGGGLVCGMPIAEGAAVAVQRRDDHHVILKHYTVDASMEERVDIALDDFYGTASLLPQESLRGLFAGPRHWAASLAGTFPILARHKKFTRRTTGAAIACYCTVPTGMAPGAALACAGLAALAAAFHLILEPFEMALLAQKIENQIAAHSCDFADAAICMLGRANEALVLKNHPHEVRGRVPLPANLLLAAIDTGAPAGEAEHVLIEDARTREFIDHLRRGDPAACVAAGKVMFEVPHSASAETDLILRLARERGDAGVHGATAPCGATVVILADNTAQARQSLAALCDEAGGRMGRKVRLCLGSSAGPAELPPVKLPPPPPPPVAPPAAH